MSFSWSRLRSLLPPRGIKCKQQEHAESKKKNHTHTPLPCNFPWSGQTYCAAVGPACLESWIWTSVVCMVGLTCGSSARGFGSTATPERQSLGADGRWLQRCPSSAAVPSPPPPNESARSDSTLPETAHLYDQTSAHIQSQSHAGEKRAK